MKSIFYTFFLVISFVVSISSVKAQCPQDYLIVSADMNSNILVYSIQVNGQAQLPVQLSISFGDGSSFNQLFTSAYTATHQYPAFGGPTYLFCVYTTDGNGCADTLCLPVVVEPCINNNIQLFANDSVSGNTLFIYPEVSGGVGPYTYNLNGAPVTLIDPFPIVVDVQSSGFYV